MVMSCSLEFSQSHEGAYFLSVCAGSGKAEVYCSKSMSAAHRIVIIQNYISSALHVNFLKARGDYYFFLGGGGQNVLHLH